MRKFYTLFMLLLLSITSVMAVNIVPIPKTITTQKGSLKLKSTTTIGYRNGDIKPIADVLQGVLGRLTGYDMVVASDGDKSTILLDVDSSLPEGSYTLDVDSKRAVLKAADSRTLALATSTIIQLVGDNNKLPAVEISDAPAFESRIVMLDVARFWQPIYTLKETIDLLHYYKVPYLHLHLTDDQYFTFGTELYPDLLVSTPEGDRRYYTKSEMKDIVEYARVRGVHIIPEIDLPGHSSNMWRRMPETFGAVGEDGKFVSLGAVNMTIERTYEAIDKLIGEVAEVFYTSDFIQLGGDEVWMGGNKELPTYDSYCKEHNLDTGTELYAYFLTRIDKYIRKYGKKTMLWEGFHNTGKIEIPRDIPVVAWDTRYYAPADLLRDGFTVINGVSNYGYLVAAMNKAPLQSEVYKWRHNEFDNNEMDNHEVIVTPKDGNITGGQICFWEQRHDVVIPQLRPHVAVSSERWWSYRDDVEFDNFKARYEATDNRFGYLSSPISYSTKWVVSAGDITFFKDVEVSLKSSRKGDIRYIVTDDYYKTPTAKSQKYSDPITLNSTKLIVAQLFSNDGKEIGYPQVFRFEKIDPIFRYKAYSKGAIKGWNEMPQVDTMNLVKEGYFGRVGDDRITEVRRELFYGVEHLGHVDTRPTNLSNPFVLKMEGVMNAPVSGKYKFQIKNQDGLYEILFGDHKLEGKIFEYKKEEFEVDVEAGDYDLTINYFYRDIQNILNVKVMLPGANEYISLEDLMQSLGYFKLKINKE